MTQRIIGLSKFLLISLSLALGSCAGQNEVRDPLPVDYLAKFSSIATASCDRALVEGVIESTPALGIEAVMVPKAFGVDGYSAAFHQAPNVYELIWETDFFFACAIANQVTLSEEAGMELDLDIEVYGNRYLVTQLDFNQNTYTTEYLVQGDLLRKATTDNAGKKIETFIRYGEELEGSLEIIQEALGRFQQ
jgi:hypothetical protein